MSRLLSAACLLLLAATTQAAEAPRPNIVFIFLDDMGWGDLHCYGHPYAKTPHIDRLAAEGTRFLQCYATGVTCCPSRTGFMTSKFPATYAKYPANGGFGDRVTITELLKKQGYATGHFGKWHIGPDEKPGTYGIDTIGPAAEPDQGRKKQRNAAAGRDAPVFAGALRFIEEHKNEPFYVNIWGHVPHHPVDPSPALLDAFGPLAVDESRFPPEMQEKFARYHKQGADVSRHMRAYLAELKSVDDAVGRLVQRLEELGLRDKTLIVVSSDQGPANSQDFGTDEKKAKRKEAALDDVRLNAMGFSGPFRGGKHNQYEGGLRIPFIVCWPGRIPAGRVDEHSVISGIDWLPTLCALTGTIIDLKQFDGEDTSAAWLGQSPHVRTKPLFWKTSNPNSAGAIRDGRWKLHHPISRRGDVELYDIVTDPGEHTNLAAEKPDIVKSLTAKLTAWQSTLPKSYDKSNDAEK
jgi:arylsulfatase A-like enzyme